MNTTAYAHLPRYERPQHFADFAQFDRREYFVALGQHRDSDALARSNFRCMLERIGGESETVLVVRDSHCMVGWVESIYIHESNSAACATADEILCALEDYPVVDDSDFSELEWTEAADYWERMSVSTRVEYLQDARLCIFAARRAELPEDPQGALLDRLNGH